MKSIWISIAYLRIHRRDWLGASRFPLHNVWKGLVKSIYGFLLQCLEGIGEEHIDFQYVHAIHRRDQEMTFTKAFIAYCQIL